MSSRRGLLRATRVEQEILVHLDGRVQRGGPPPPSTPTAAVRTPASAARVERWLADHGLNRGIRTTTVDFDAAEILTGGPAAFAGVVAVARFAIGSLGAAYARRVLLVTESLIYGPLVAQQEADRG